MYIDCVMSTTFHFVFETNNNDEDKEFENLDHVYKALSNSGLHFTKDLTTKS